MRSLALLIPFILPVAQAQLNDLAKAAGIQYFGSATDNPELTDAPYVAGLSNGSQFGQITPGNSQKWDATEPSNNTFTFTKGDVVTQLASDNNQILRCHTLIWHNQLPSWVTDGTWTKESLTAVLKNHINEVVTHYKGQCYAWDVVNEALNDDGTYRDSIFQKINGEDYIPIAFEAAAAADPDAKLYYNDFSIENSGPKATGALNIVKLVQAAGAKIDGVGLQSHFIVGSTPSKSDLTATMEAYTTLGVEVAITELDIRMTLPSDSAKLAQQSTDYENTVSACVGVAGCVGITIWDYTDKYSWVPSTFPGEGAALPWDEDLEEKPALDGIITALKSS